MNTVFKLTNKILIDSILSSLLSILPCMIRRYMWAKTPGTAPQNLLAFVLDPYPISFKKP